MQAKLASVLIELGTFTKRVEGLGKFSSKLLGEFARQVCSATTIVVRLLGKFARRERSRRCGFVLAFVDPAALCIRVIRPIHAS